MAISPNRHFDGCQPSSWGCQPDAEECKKECMFLVFADFMFFFWFSIRRENAKQNKKKEQCRNQKRGKRDLPDSDLEREVLDLLLRCWRCRRGLLSTLRGALGLLELLRVVRGALELLGLRMAVRGALEQVGLEEMLTWMVLRSGLLLTLLLYL